MFEMTLALRDAHLDNIGGQMRTINLCDALKIGASLGHVFRNLFLGKKTAADAPTGMFLHTLVKLLTPSSEQREMKPGISNGPRGVTVVPMGNKHLCIQIVRVGNIQVIRDGTDTAENSMTDFVMMRSDDDDTTMAVGEFGISVVAVGNLVTFDASDFVTHCLFLFRCVW